MIAIWGKYKTGYSELFKMAKSKKQAIEILRQYQEGLGHNWKVYAVKNGKIVGEYQWKS